MIIGLMEFTSVLASVSFDGEDIPGWLLLAGPASAVAVYTGLYRYYRNTDKSHSFERETSIQTKPVTGGEQKIDEVRGTTKSRIDGSNVSSHRQRVQRH